MLEEKVVHLGKPSEIPLTLDTSVLDRVPNRHPGTNYIARFICPELTSLCPVTGQPDYATLIVDYIPNQWLVESKSLKLFLFSFRNHRGFHEDCSLTIGKALVDLIKPKWFQLGAFWNPRGGISIDVFWETGELPEDISVPPHDMKPFRGRDAR